MRRLAQLFSARSVADGGRACNLFLESLMANPLKMLKLKPQTVQSIQEIPIDAAPRKVWSLLIDANAWFQFSDAPGERSRQSLDLRPGGLWTAENPNGSAMLMGTVVYYEPGKLLRVAGQLGLTHLPVNSVVIFELQPKPDGKSTLLRVGTRMFGYMGADVKKGYKNGWKQLLARLKTLAEK
jgi:uncharacterized protein YndB with AHSA1/START domain